MDFLQTGMVLFVQMGDCYYFSKKHLQLLINCVTIYLYTTALYCGKIILKC